MLLLFNREMQFSFDQKKLS